jgi:hypothetical protein
MNYSILLTMSILSFLFGCGGKKVLPPAEPWPRFPATDHPDTRIETIPMDEGYSVSTFYIPEDKQHIYVVETKITSHTRNGEIYETESLDHRILCLDTKGKTLHQLDFPKAERSASASIGILENQTVIRLGNHFLVLDTQQFNIQEKIPVYFSQLFPSKHKVELMTFDEQRDNYQLAFDNMLQKSASCKWLDWTPGREFYILARDASGKRTAWDPPSWQDADLAELKSRYEAIPVPMNPGGSQADSSRIISDGVNKVQEVEYLSGGTELDYPNYKNRTIVQHEMTLGQRKLHFSTTDQKRHDLHLGYSDNRMLSAADGSVWVTYEARLYRIE